MMINNFNKINTKKTKIITKIERKDLIVYTL